MNDFGTVVWTTVVNEFSDISDVDQAVRAVLRLFMAALLGGALGYERELKGKAAGLRTHMLVALGSALVVLIPLQGGMPLQDMSRVIQGVVAGIGFLGAGAILKSDSGKEIHGLTTAASIWMASAIGLAAGMGHHATAVLATGGALFVLAVLSHFEEKI